MSVLRKLSRQGRAALAALRVLALPADQEPADFPFAASDIEQLQRVRADPSVPAIDAQTWNDLLLDRYSALLSREVSIFGQQVLHQRLRAGLGDQECQALGGRLRTLMADPVRLGELHTACRDLRRADTDIAALLFASERPAEPGWVRWWWLPPAGLLASVAAAAWTPYAWLGAIYAVYRLIALQMHWHEKVREWERAMNAVQMLLRACTVLGAHGHALTETLAGLAARAGQVNRSLSRSPGLALIPGQRTYADWFMLANVTHYFKSIGIVYAQRALLRDCYTHCANLEADIALARHLALAPVSCWADRAAGAGIALEQAVHPLLDRAAPLSVGLQDKGAFISGQNGIGKSTLLRTIGLNLITARAFGFCYAASARLAVLPVYASMQSEDSLLGGESLYMAELRRAKELLAAADGPHGGIYIIDEIFRGTNHLESVAAAASVLDVLAAKGTVIVSSHNVVLASLLEHRLAPWRVAADGDQPLALLPGVLARTNGIALLAEHDLGSHIGDRAAKVFDWLSAYLAHPAGAGEVLV